MLKKLQEIGLKEKEALVYIELLKLGTQPASVVARRLEIPKSTGNFNLEMLVKKGFATKTKRGTTFLYSAEDPNVIIEMLNYQKRKNAKEIDNKITSLNSVVTELKSVQYGNVQKPEITFYEGVDGLIKLFNDAADSSHRLFGALTIGDDIDQELLNYQQEVYIPKRKLHKQKSLFLFNDNNECLAYKKKDKEMNRITLILPRDQFPFENCCHIYGDKVAFYNYKKNNLLGVIIENKFITKTQISLFKASLIHAQSLDINKEYKNLKIDF